MRVLYTPFGTPHQEVSGGGNRTFAGHPRDDVTGLVYMKARWHSPETGTFLSVDPLVPNQTDPQAYNAYAYARNNPIARIDPQGMATISVEGAFSTLGIFQDNEDKTASEPPRLYRRLHL